MEWLYKISITCFAASYTVVFFLEAIRIFFRANVGKIFTIGLTTAGIFAHTVYLIFQDQLEFNAQGIWLGNWFAWCLATAWLLAAAYLWISIRKPKSVIGIFILPLVMVLIWIGIQLGDETQFTANRARNIWRMVHGISLLLGTAVVVLGFIFGLLYLLQARKLKLKKTAPSVFRLPSLEWLQQSSEKALVTSALLLGLGLISGIAINQIQSEGGSRIIAWSDPVIWTSGILFLWLFIATLFNLVYQPARQGRKVAYLVVASFLFLMLELGIVWWAGHATDSAEQGWLGGKSLFSKTELPVELPAKQFPISVSTESILLDSIVPANNKEVIP